jgi:hypothetical protein
MNTEEAISEQHSVMFNTTTHRMELLHKLLVSLPIGLRLRSNLFLVMFLIKSQRLNQRDTLQLQTALLIIEHRVSYNQSEINQWEVEANADHAGLSQLLPLSNQTMLKFTDNSQISQSNSLLIVFQDATAVEVDSINLPSATFSNTEHNMVHHIHMLVKTNTVTTTLLKFKSE